MAFANFGEEKVMKKQMFRGATLCVLAMGATVARADEVTYWNNVLLDCVRTTGAPPPKASRAMAITHLAVYDAVNSIAKTHNPYHYTTNVNPNCSKEAAVAQAAYQALDALFPTRHAVLSAQLTNRLDQIQNGQAKTDGISVGAAAGADLLALRANDGSNLPADPYLGDSSTPGKWRPTPNAFAPGLLPRWREVTPFGLASGSQFRQPGPPSLTSSEYTDAYNEVKRLGKSTGSDRTQDQTDIALYWADGGGTSTPPGHWNRIAQEVGTSQGNTIEENARMFALLNMTVADAGIACWDMKYEYSFWRPVSAIQLGDTDGNAQTAGDATWMPLIATPPFPTYTSGHSTFSGGAAEILGSFFGTDEIAFTDAAEGVNLTRSFTGFDHAAGEAADSRLYGGIHYRFDNQIGLEMGTQIGTYNYQHYLTPVPEPGTVFALSGAAAFFLLGRRRKVQV